MFLAELVCVEKALEDLQAEAADSAEDEAWEEEAD